MTVEPIRPTRELPDRPNLRYLKREAKRRVADGEFSTLHEAQLTIAREHGARSWPAFKALVESRALDVNARAAQLARLACSADVRAAQALLEREPELARYDLTTACVTGEAETVAALLAKDPAAANRTSAPLDMPPLLCACFSRLARIDDARAAGVREAARLLIDAGADVNVIVENDQGRCTPLYGAAGVLNDAELTKLVLDAGADPDEGASGTDGTEALYHACDFADTECLRLILEAKPRQSWVSYCLGRALDFPDNARSNLFLDHGAVQPGWPGLAKPISRQRSPELVERMLELGADPNVRDDGVPVVVEAVRAGRDDLADLLVRYGADDTMISAHDRAIGRAVRGDSTDQIGDIDPWLLEYAANCDDGDAIRRLVAAGLDVDDTRTDPEWSALHRACWTGNAEAARVCIELGADIELRSSWGGRPIGSVMHGSENCFDPHGGPKEGLPEEIPQAGYVEIVDLLFTAGVTPPARVGGSEAVADALRRHGVPDGD